MELTTKRFGKIPIKEEDIVSFAGGLLGFEKLTEFILVDISENPAFKWLQSTVEPDLSFLLVDPFLVTGGYSLALDDELLEELHIDKERDVLVYTIVSVPKGGFKHATTNLVGPLIINWREKRAKQIILEDPKLDIKHPLFPQDTKKAVSSGG